VKAKPLSPVLDSRHIKILAAKKTDLKDSITFIFLDEDKYGFYDMAQLKRIVSDMDRLEPSGHYVTHFKKLRFQIFDKSEIKNRDLIISFQADEDLNVDEVEANLRSVFHEARNITFVHVGVDIEYSI
jgi:hypothetical protein